MLSAVVQSRDFKFGTESPLLLADPQAARELVDSVAGPLRDIAQERHLLFGARYLFGSFSGVSDLDLRHLQARTKATGAIISVDKWSEPPSLADTFFGGIFGIGQAHFVDLFRPKEQIPLFVEAGGEKRPLRYLIVGPNVGGPLEAVVDFDSQVLYGPQIFGKGFPAELNFENRPLTSLNRGAHLSW